MNEVNLKWDQLGFEFQPTRANLRFAYRDGAWQPGQLFTTYDVTLSVASNCLHYGQAIFEGLKAFRCRDGKIRIFRPEANGERINSSARHLLMPEFPVADFVEAVKTVVRENQDYVPPYGTGGSLYLRPVMFGTTPQIGIASSKEYQLVFLVVPVGAYYKGGIKPVDAMISDYDRAAPRGTGHIKAAGNYAASLYPSKVAKEHHCQVALFLDPGSRRFIDEFGTSNFLAISKDGKRYLTPESTSVLPSITNLSLMQLAKDLGLEVERRPLRVEELADFGEVAACGTAVVLTPVHRIFYGDKVFTYSEEIGPVLRKLHDRMLGVQFGELSDEHHWLTEI